MKAFFQACKQLDYTCWLHDQYRDYYMDAPSWNSDFAVHEQDTTTPPDAFPGTRFKNDWKEGYIPFMDHWDGGTQSMFRRIRISTRTTRIRARIR